MDVSLLLFEKPENKEQKVVAEERFLLQNGVTAVQRYSAGGGTEILTLFSN